MHSAHAAGFGLLSGCGMSAVSRPVELQAPTAPLLATPRPFNAQHMPNIPNMFAERLKLQKRIMTLLEPIIHEQAAAEARNEAAMRQAYARATSRRCNDVPSDIYCRRCRVSSGIALVHSGWRRRNPPQWLPRGRPRRTGARGMSGGDMSESV